MGNKVSKLLSFDNGTGRGYQSIHLLMRISPEQLRRHVVAFASCGGVEIMESEEGKP
jgi:hypothetical protein